jgi:hypothetical protein
MRDIDCRRNLFRTYSTPFTIGYHHARLVMNRQFYGARRGLPTSLFDIPYLVGYYEEPRWVQRWSASVIDDELFLFATHTLRFCGTEGAFRDLLNWRRYNICAHIRTESQHSQMNEDSLIRKQYECLYTIRRELVEMRNHWLRRTGNSPTDTPEPFRLSMILHF